MKRIAFILFFGTIFLLLSCSVPNSEEDEIDYLTFLSQLVAEEPYIGFFALEEQLISEKTEEYLKARKKCFLGIYRSKDEPDDFTESFVTFCLKKKLLKKEDQAAWEKVLTILSFELYANMPIFEYETEDVIEHRDLVFAKYPNKQIALDLFLPKTPVADPVPTVVCIHGGGWMVNRRIWFEPWAKYLAAHGIASVTIDYRMLPAVTVRECVYDSKAAVRWVRANADKYHLDPKKIGAIGASAGAHLACLLGTTANDPLLEGEGGSHHESSEVQAVVGISTPSYNLQSDDWYLEGLGLSNSEAIALSPLETVSDTSAPLYLIHGTTDEVVPPRNSQELSDRYQKYGASVKISWINGEGHGFYEGNDKAIKMATDFFIQQFSPYK